MTNYADAHDLAQHRANTYNTPFAVVSFADARTPRFEAFYAPFAVKAHPARVTTIVAPAT